MPRRPREGERSSSDILRGVNGPLTLLHSEVAIVPEAGGVII